MSESQISDEALKKRVHELLRERKRCNCIQSGVHSDVCLAVGELAVKIAEESYSKGVTNGHRAGYDQAIVDGKARIKKLRPERLTDWAVGDAVVITKEVRNIQTPERLYPGTEGELRHLCRIQDGHEVWEVSALGRNWAVSHEAMKKI